MKTILLFLVLKFIFSPISYDFKTELQKFNKSVIAENQKNRLIVKVLDSDEKLQVRTWGKLRQSLMRNIILLPRPTSLI
jgi:hypothetical protein